MSVGNHAMIGNNCDINVTFSSFGIAKYAKFVEWGVQILRDHYFQNEFGDTQFFFVDLTFSYRPAERGGAGGANAQGPGDF